MKQHPMWAQIQALTGADRAAIQQQIYRRQAASPVALYRLYSRSGELLYVGISNSPRARCQRHRARAWWAEVDINRMTETWFNNPADAGLAEAVAIASETPKYNRSRGGEHPGSQLWVKRWQVAKE